MRKPFQKELTDYEQARQDYGRSLPPDVLDDILERSLNQYPETTLSFGVLVDMKVMKRIQDSIDRMNKNAAK